MRRILTLAVPVVAAAFLAGCGGGDGPSGSGSEAGTVATPNPRTTPGATVTGTVIDCKRFDALAERVVQAQTALYSGGAGGLEALLAALDELRDEAPADVDAALDDLATAFRRAEALLEEPSTAGPQSLQKEATRLASAGQRISEYVLDHC